MGHQSIASPLLFPTCFWEVGVGGGQTTWRNPVWARRKNMQNSRRTETQAQVRIRHTGAVTLQQCPVSINVHDIDTDLVCENEANCAPASSHKTSEVSHQIPRESDLYLQTISVWCKKATLQIQETIYEKNYCFSTLVNPWLSDSQSNHILMWKQALEQSFHPVVLSWNAKTDTTVHGRESRRA